MPWTTGSLLTTPFMDVPPQRKKEEENPWNQPPGQPLGGQQQEWRGIDLSPTDRPDSYDTWAKAWTQQYGPIQGQPFSIRADPGTPGRMMVFDPNTNERVGSYFTPAYKQPVQQPQGQLPMQPNAQNDWLRRKKVDEMRTRLLRAWGYVHHNQPIPPEIWTSAQQMAQDWATGAGDVSPMTSMWGAPQTGAQWSQAQQQRDFARAMMQQLADQRRLGQQQIEAGLQQAEIAARPPTIQALIAGLHPHQATPGPINPEIGKELSAVLASGGSQIHQQQVARAYQQQAMAAQMQYIGQMVQQLQQAMAEGNTEHAQALMNQLNAMLVPTAPAQ